MGNYNIQGPVPLTGQGFVAKRNGNFLPGEFKRLTNMEIEEDQLVNRRNIKIAAGGQDAPQEGYTNLHPFIGQWNEWMVMVSATDQYAVSPLDRVTMWDPQSLPVNAAAGSFHRILNFFRYAEHNYWLTLEGATNLYAKIHLYETPVKPNTDGPDGVTFADLTSTMVVEFNASIINFNKLEYRNCFIHKDRLWIVTSTHIYVSKANDFKEFDPELGAFEARFPDQTINFAYALADSVYVLCDNSVRVITYSADLNTDSSIRVLADNVGGDHGCVFEDTPFFVNQIGIYQISNNTVEKMLDNEFDVGLDYYDNQLTPFEDYLILSKYRDVNYERFEGRTVAIRVNLHPNPSQEVSNSGYVAGTPYMTRARSNEVPGYIGDWSHRIQKVNDDAAVARRNLFPNPAAEAGTAATYWIPNADVLPSRDNSTAPYAGTYSFRFEYNPVGGNPGHFQVQSLKCPGVVAEHNYHVRFRIRRSSAVGTCQGLEVYLHWLDSFDSIIGDSYNLGSVLDIVNSSQWYPWTADLVAPEYAVAFYFEINEFDSTHGGGAGGDLGETFYMNLDEILVEDRTNTNVSYLPAYFDGNTTDVPPWNYSWVGTANQSQSIRTGGDSGLPADAVRLEEYTPDLVVEPLKTYVFGMAVKPFTGTHDRSIKVEFKQKTAAGQVLNVQTLLLNGGTIPPDNGEWTYMTTPITTAATIVKMSYSVVIQEPGLSQGQGYYFDNRILELASTYSGYFDGASADSPTVVHDWTSTPHLSTSTYQANSSMRRLYDNGKQFIPGQARNFLGYNVYFINVRNGAIHVCDYANQRDLSNTERGYIVDVKSSNYKDTNGNYNVFFMTSSFVSETGTSITRKNNISYMNTYKDTDFSDLSVLSNGITKKYRPKVEVEIDSFVPDGNEYLLKKFRSLELMAIPPFSDFHIRFGFDNRELSNPIEISSSLERWDGHRPQFPHRIGINQRAQSITIFIGNSTYDEPLEYPGWYEPIEISDIRVLWSYIQKLHSYKALV